MGVQWTRGVKRDIRSPSERRVASRRGREAERGARWREATDERGSLGWTTATVVVVAVARRRPRTVPKPRQVTTAVNPRVGLQE